MIILITGASHVGKTALAQKLLEKYNFPYLSIDHLKMGHCKAMMPHAINIFVISVPPLCHIKLSYNKIIKK